MLGTVQPALWGLGLTAGVAALTLAAATLKAPDASDASMPKPLNQLLVWIFGWLAIVVLFLPSIYAFGPGWPLLTLTSLGLAAWLALRYLNLKPFYRFQMPIAVLGLAAAVLFWL